MLRADSRRHINTKAGVALLLTFSAGCVDIVGYLTLYHAFVAHMTGDTVHLAQDVLQWRWGDAGKTGCVIAAFVLGSVIGRAVIEIGSRAGVRRTASATLLIEVVLIVTVILLADSYSGRQKPLLALLIMLAAAMGMQTATLTRVGSLTIHTTFVTGMLNKLAQLLSHGAFLSYDVLRGRTERSHLRPVFSRTRFIFSIWLLYVAGAAAGTWMNAAWGIRSLLLPAGMVVLALAVDQLAPLSLEEEHDEPER